MLLPQPLFVKLHTILFLVAAAKSSYLPLLLLSQEFQLSTKSSVGRAKEM